MDSNLETSYGKVAGEDIAVAVSLNIASDWVQGVKGDSMLSSPSLAVPAVSILNSHPVCSSASVLMDQGRGEPHPWLSERY